MEPGCEDKAGKQRMAVTRIGGEFGMKLAGDKPRVFWQLDHFNQIVDRQAGKSDAGLLEDVSVVVLLTS